MLRRRVLILIQEFEDVLGSIRMQDCVTGPLVGFKAGYDDALSESISNRVDGFAEPQEYAERIQLALQRCLLHLRLATHLVPLEVPPAQLIQILDVVRVAPFDESFDAIAV